MKIIEKNEEKAEEEATCKAYLLSLQSDTNFQKYYIDGIVAPLLKQLQSLKWLYNDPKLVSATDEEIADIIRMNRNTHAVVSSLLNPVINEEKKSTL